MHFSGARQLLDRRFRSHNIVDKLRANTILHSIILQICWHNTIWALLSKEPTEIPDIYKNTAISINLERLDNCTHGSILDTVGCPELLYLTLSLIANREISRPEEILQLLLTNFKQLVQREVLTDDAMHAENI
jgi:hypothetical protein